MKPGILICAILFAAFPACADDCLLPLSPRVPDGRFASDEDMRRAHHEMQTFVGRADDFLHCIDTAQKEDAKTFQALGSNDPDRVADYKARQHDFEQRYNAGVDAQKAAADNFNKQLHIWRGRTGQSSTKSG